MPSDGEEDINVEGTSTPILPRTPPSPALSLGYFSAPFERFRKDELSDWSGFTLLDTIETYFDSHLDLLERRLKKHADKLKAKAEEALGRPLPLRSTSGDLLYSRDLDKELQKFKIRVSERLSKLTSTWHSSKVIRTREKVSFFFGVMNVLFTTLLFGLAPSWVHISYTVQSAYLLPIRFYTYKKKHWHYFLFDLCYFINILALVYIWILPHSASLFVACYLLTHGSLASAIITWRNSLVFHDYDKVTSLFIHMYPTLTFSVIRHFYPDSHVRFPALAQLPHLQPLRALFLSAVIYMLWQGLYWKLILVDRRKKIESGQRATSFSFLLNDKRGIIGRMMNSVQPQYREVGFMTGQLVYAVVTELPAVYLLYDSSFWSGAFLIFIFGVSVWNGGGFYIEVFGRKFERELEKLRKELAEATAASSLSTPAPSTHDGHFGRNSPSEAENEISSAGGSPVVIARGGGGKNDEDVDMLKLDLNGEVSEVKKDR